ncbi:lipopolysaccharide biosynthesis protein [Geobacter sp. FeAm09]|uniref:lipopolysaccharide biosynthesis protein n=1 Tax=Geobacter sp. FeAm09 TaxID=2597769 RepID=UPI0011EC3A3E|nr:lipopolysaccharide biosynthesis protein [Geobacter sp. FeAm09]QEM68659.1 lipopolysaccharide biosynthesis protein [Geobacter sp. FeAm09]
MRKKLILNSFSGTTLYLINVVVAFIMSPVLIRALGNRDYGLWELVMSVIGYMGLLDLGIGPALIRFVSVADGKQDRSDLQQTISTAFAFFIVAGGLALVLFAALGYYPRIITGNDTKDIANLSTVFLLFGLDASIMFPLQVFTATLMGLQRHYLINSARGILTIVRALLTFYLLQRYAGNGLIVLALLEPIFCLIQFAFFSAAIVCDNSIPRMTFRAVTWRKLHELFTFGAKSATMLVASRLQNQSVPLIIGNVIGLGQIVYFVMPNRLIDYAKGVSQALGLPLIPYFGASIGRNDRDELLKSWFSTTLALQVVSLAMPVAIFFYGESFLAIWIGQEYASAGRGVMHFLLLGLLADSLAINASRILVAQGIHGKNAVIWLVLSILSIPVGIGGASAWGVTGVVMGTTMVMVVGNIVTVLLACSAMKISLQIYFKETLMHLVLPLLLLFIVMQAFTLLYPVKSYPNLLAQVLLAGCIYVTAIWCFTLDDGMKAKLLERIRSIMPQGV